MIGIILLDARFPRLLGDVGNPESFPFPVLYEIVKDAIPSRVVMERDPSLLAPFIQAAKNLERKGAGAITTSCGFLALWQRKISSSVEVPVFASSLLQVPWAYRVGGARGRIGILTADAASLTKDHLEGVGAGSIPTVIRGMKLRSEFYRVYIENNPDLEFERAEREVALEAAAMMKENPDVSALVLECTNMPVFRKAIREAVRVPLFDILTLANFIWSGVRG